MLVGSENMQIIKQDTDKLNKFDSFRVDYLKKIIGMISKNLFVGRQKSILNLAMMQ